MATIAMTNSATPAPKAHLQGVTGPPAQTAHLQMQISSVETQMQHRRPQSRTPYDVCVDATAKSLHVYMTQKSHCICNMSV